MSCSPCTWSQEMLDVWAHVDHHWCPAAVPLLLSEPPALALFCPLLFWLWFYTVSVSSKLASSTLQFSWRSCWKRMPWLQQISQDIKPLGACLYLGFCFVSLGPYMCAANSVFQEALYNMKWEKNCRCLCPADGHGWREHSYAQKNLGFQHQYWVSQAV